MYYWPMRKIFKAHNEGEFENLCVFSSIDLCLESSVQEIEEETGRVVFVEVHNLCPLCCQFSSGA